MCFMRGGTLGEVQPERIIREIEIELYPKKGDNVTFFSPPPYIDNPTYPTRRAFPGRGTFQRSWLCLK